MAGIAITIDMDMDRIEAVIDEEVISAWIEDRLNDARSHFIQSASRGGGGGRVYRQHGKLHRASAPGEYPATDSGRLVSSVDYEMAGPFEGHLQSDVEYALYLTTGTSKMAARKMLADALEDVLKARPATDELAQAVTFEVE